MIAERVKRAVNSGNAGQRDKTSGIVDSAFHDSVRFFVFLSCSMALWRDSSPQLQAVSSRLCK